uniref:Reverse transcriptase domain-containing protein n=1 Tax=Xenopus tropicalis TaxID=8364 RepID=A0A803KCG6_XENTR
MSLLMKGLSFCPTPQGDYFELEKDLNLFCRKILLKKYFKKDKLREPDIVDKDKEILGVLESLLDESDLDQKFQKANRSGLKKKSDFTPGYGISNYVSVFRDMASDALLKLNHKRQSDNLSKAERQALKELKSWEDVQIKPSDKGGNVVIWDNDMYILEAKRQLHSDTYKRLYGNPTEGFVAIHNNLINDAFRDLLISEQEKSFLLVDNPRVATFYLLPKIHKNKVKPPGRPIVSGNGNLTENTSKYVDCLLRKYVTALPSFVRDTMEVLARLNGTHVMKGTYLVTLDVEALYTSIRHKDGIEAVKYFLDIDPSINPDLGHFIIKMLSFILHHNYFVFNNVFYLQIQGTAMGTSCAPTYANLFLGKWEQDVVFGDDLSFFTNYIPLWIRYIDDILFLWEGPLNLLNDFITILNTNSLNIRLTQNISQNMVSFLDLTIGIDEKSNITTDLYRKETATNTILHFESYHKNTVKRSVPTGEFLRLRRNCTSFETFRLRSEQLKTRLKDRGYSNKILKQAYHRALTTNRDNLLKTKPVKTHDDQQLRFITTYGPQTYKVQQVIQELWPVIHQDADLRSILPETISFCYRRCQNLGDHLTRSHFTGRKRQPPVKGTFRCGSCVSCSMVKNQDSFTDRFGNLQHVNDYINCKTSNVIYCIECPCDRKYVGMTTQRLNKRIQKHVSTINMAKEDRQKNKILSTVASHFLTYHNGNPEKLQFWGIEHVSLGIRGGNISEFLLKRESKWIYTLNTLAPTGLNEKIDFSTFLR